MVSVEVQTFCFRSKMTPTSALAKVAFSVEASDYIPSSFRLQKEFNSLHSKSKVLIFFLAIGQRLFLASRGHLQNLELALLYSSFLLQGRSPSICHRSLKQHSLIKVLISKGPAHIMDSFEASTQVRIYLEADLEFFLPH